MPVFDVRCDKCGTIWEERKSFSGPTKECAVCGSNFATTLMPFIKGYKAKDPYDTIPSISSKKIKSFANDRRKGGKNTV